MLDNIEALRATGLTWREVAQQLGISTNELVAIRARAEALRLEQERDARVDAALTRDSRGLIPTRP